MVNAAQEIGAIWLIMFINSLFLGVRLHLRISQRRESLQPSDYLILLAFAILLAGAILTTSLDVQEIRFLASEPDYPRNLDISAAPFMGYMQAGTERYIKGIYVLLICHNAVLCVCKATLLVFFYEVFPKRFRKVLHAASAIVVCTFVANILETVFWCYPLKRMWATTEFLSGNHCALKLIPDYNAAQFASHLVATIVVNSLPLLLLHWVGGKRREVAFAMSIAGFGLLTVTASVIAFVFLLQMQVLKIDLNARHIALISSAVEEAAMFWAGAAGVLSVRKKRREEADSGRGEEEEVLEMKGLVIEVEKRWSVTVEIVEAWGHGWKDPWAARSAESSVS